MQVSIRPQNAVNRPSNGGCACACSLMAMISDHKDKKSKCCKSFKHGKRCKKCPGKKK